MKLKILLLAVVMTGFSFSASAKIVHRWDPQSLSQGKFVVEKTAFIRKEAFEPSYQIESKHILVKVDYTGKLFLKKTMFAKR